MGNLTKNFSASEFKCQCGCGLDTISAATVVSMQAIRDAAGAAVVVVSGLRCALHNATPVKEGGAGSSVKGSGPLKKGWLGAPDASDHTRGEAVDFRIAGFSQDRAFEFLQSLYAAGKIPFLRYCYRIKHNAKTNVHCSFGGKKRANVFDESIHN